MGPRRGPVFAIGVAALIIIGGMMITCGMKRGVIVVVTPPGISVSVDGRAMRPCKDETLESMNKHKPKCRKEEQTARTYRYVNNGGRKYEIAARGPDGVELTRAVDIPRDGETHTFVLELSSGVLYLNGR
jgi:hypothetical protein